MKRLILLLIMMIVLQGIAFAEWQFNFEETYFDKGIDQAVIVALEEGISPDMIIEQGVLIGNLNPQNLVMALYCAGVNGQDIKEAAFNNGISEMILTAGYKKSLVECSDTMADSQAYNTISVGFSTRTTGEVGSSSASPSTFLQ